MSTQSLAQDRITANEDNLGNSFVSTSLSGLRLPIEIYAPAYGIDGIARVRLPTNLRDHEIAFVHELPEHLYLLKPDMGMVLLAEGGVVESMAVLALRKLNLPPLIDRNARFLACLLWLSLNGLSNTNYPATIHLRLDYNSFTGPVGLGLIDQWKPTPPERNDGQVGWGCVGQSWLPRTTFPIVFDLEEKVA